MNIPIHFKHRINRDIKPLCIPYTMCLAFRIFYFAFLSFTNEMGIGTGSKRNNMNTFIYYTIRIHYTYILCIAYLVLDLYVYVPLKPDRTGHCVTTGRWPLVRLLFFVIKYYKIFLMPIKLVLHYIPDYLCYNENMSIKQIWKCLWKN